MKEFLVKNSENWFLWLPFILAFGAAMYFAMPFEPNIKYITLIFIVCFSIFLFKKTNGVLRCVTLFLFGFLYAVFYTQIIVNTPVLKYDIRDTIITANVIDIDNSEDKTRLILSVPGKDLKLSDTHNTNIKLTINEDAQIPNIGDTIRAQAYVFAPARMEAPESFDYSRWAYFNNLTGTGFITDYETLAHQDITSINKIRQAIHVKADSFLTDSLILGYKNSVPKTDKKIWTTAGIGHIWSISGFHITLIGGWLFALFYLICRSICFITKRVPARITATICAWATLLGYVFISGASVATWRAFLMASLVFIAVLVGRNAVSMRNICIAFLILFFVNPHFVTQVGFQLSFAAIFGLIWFFGDKKFDTADKSIFYKIKHWLYVAIMTTLIATVFTLPFIASNFNSVPLYSLLGNLILVPVFSVIIMPLVILGIILSVLDCNLLLRIADNVYNFSLYIAQRIADLPMSNLGIPHIPNIAFIILVLAFICLVLVKPLTNSTVWFYRRANYILFSICISVAVSIVVLQPHPVFYATPDHELIGMVYNKKLEFNKARAANHYFAFDTFRKLNNEEPVEYNIRRKCPDGVCIYKSDKFTVAYIQKFVPLQKHFTELCYDKNIDFIVSYFDIYNSKCNHKILRNGFVIYKNGHIKYTPTNRWWHNQHE